MEEEWRWAFEGHYEVSNFGNIRSVDRVSVSYGNRLCNRKGRIMIINYVPGKYGMIVLSMNGKISTYSVHRLVAKAFLPNPDNLVQVDHIDRNRHNNHVSNLRWVSHSCNQQNRSENPRGALKEKYISMCGKRVHFCKTIDGVRTERYFANVEEAKAFRLELLGF
jgi:hypothetical protein